MAGQSLADRDNMMRIDDLDAAIRFFHDDIEPADQDKLRMRHCILVSIRCTDEVRSFPARAAADDLYLHELNVRRRCRGANAFITLAEGQKAICDPRTFSLRGLPTRRPLSWFVLYAL
jgi:hypothetical protein